MMKKIFWGCVVLVLCVACAGRQTQTSPLTNLTEMADSAAYHADTMPHTPVVEEDLPPQPSEADELFDDFIFNFALDDRLQRARIRFPLSFYKGDSCIKVHKQYWKHDYLFARQSYYSLLFDNEEDMDLVGDTTLKSVQVEWIYLKTRTVKKLYFQRIKGMWMLEAVNLRNIQTTGDEDFVSFYTLFATDSVFQQAHVRNPLQFITIDPDDEFSILETTLEPGQWMAFRSVLPTDHLSNINYGQRNDDDSPTKMLKINGIGNGYSVVYYFRRRAGEWELYKYEDTSI